jgi:hypothetical protein
VTSDDGPLRSPYRAVRVVRAPDDGPWPGTLVSTAAGDAIVLVDSDTLGSHWRGWQAEPGGHVLAPIDLVRRVDGHDVALPVCTERLDDFVRRRASRMPLTIGECVTIGVSVLRGCAPISGDPDVTGDWWLDSSGMPVLATDRTPQRALDAAADALEAVAVAVEARLRPAWGAAIAVITGERITAHDLADAEHALFSAATPEPLVTMTLAPRSARELGGRDRVDGAALDPPERSAWQRLIGHADAEWADTLSRATTTVWRRLRSGARPRRAPLLVAGVAAAAVLIGGALWPAAGGVADGGDARGIPSVAGAPPAEHGDAAGPASGPDMQEPPATPTDGGSTRGLESVAAALLDARTACAGDAECLAAVVADPGMSVPAGPVELPAPERVLSLLDDFGGVAVLRVDAADGTAPSQLVVITRREERWLLRDVHDVAQQP